MTTENYIILRDVSHQVGVQSAVLTWKDVRGQTIVLGKLKAELNADANGLGPIFVTLTDGEGKSITAAIPTESLDILTRLFVARGVSNMAEVVADQG